MRCFIIGVLTRALFYYRSVDHVRCFISGVLTTCVVSLVEC